MKGLGRPAYILCISLLWGIFLYIEKWFDKKEIVDDGSMKRSLTIWSSKVDVFVQLHSLLHLNFRRFLRS